MPRYPATGTPQEMKGQQIKGSGGQAPVLIRIDHVGIACHDLDEKVAFYESLFDLTVMSREVNEDQGVREAMLHVADVPGGSSWIQLIEPLAADTPVGRFLARRGEGIHHIGYGVHDLTQALASIGASGVRLLDQRPRHGSMGASIAFLHPGDLGGVLTELVETAPGSRGGVHREARG
jgi:methylmalonyl-CoA/ethylmalonyl-CoA epimerase